MVTRFYMRLLTFLVSVYVIGFTDMGREYIQYLKTIPAWGTWISIVLYLLLILFSPYLYLPFGILNYYASRGANQVVKSTTGYRAKEPEGVDIHIYTGGEDDPEYDYTDMPESMRNSVDIGE